jgi:enamine deaminase RidA (YjgF/YER057c/UK114 family)
MRLLLPGFMAIGLLATLLPVSGQSPEIRFLNPDTIGKPRGYTHVVEIKGPSRVIYIAGQLGYDIDGNVPAPGDFRAQATQVYENLKNALASVEAKFEDVVKLNAYLTDIRAQLPVYREVRDKYVNVAAPPASTTIEIPRLARDGALIEVEAIAVLRGR